MQEIHTNNSHIIKSDIKTNIRYYGVSVIAVSIALLATPSFAREIYEADEIIKLAELSESSAMKMAQVVTPYPLKSPAVAPKASVPKEIELIVPLSERGVYLGDILVSLRGETAYFDAAKIAELIKNQASPSAVEKIRALGANGKISTSVLSDNGLSAVWDPGLLAIDILISPSDKERRQIEVAQLEREDSGLFIKPANFSIYANLRTSLDYSHMGANKGLADPYFDIGLGGRIFGAAFDNELSYDSATDEFRRNATRFVFDNEENAIRTIIGDIRPQVRGYQSGFDLLGVSVASAYQTLQPYKNLRPRGQGSFTLDQASSVDVVINGRVVNRLKLDSGSYDLKDFPFLDGENRVQFIVEDRTGKRELANFDLFFDRSLLAAGLSEWSYSLGSSSQRGTNGPDYNNGKFVFSGFYRKGVSNSVTMGGNLQIEGKSGIAGYEFLRGTKLGVLGIDFANSWSDSKSGSAFNLSFNRATDSGNNNGGINWGLGISSRTKYFGTNDNYIANNSQSFDASVFLSRFLGNNASFYTSADYSKGREAFEDNWSVRFGYGKKITNSIGFNTDIAYTKNRFGNDWVFRIQFSSKFGKSGSSVLAYENKDSRLNYSLQNSGSSQFGQWGANANIDNSKIASAVNGSVSLAASRADLGISHSTYYDNSFTAKTDETTSLRVSTAFGFADGAFAWGRPIYSAFAIPIAHKTLKGHKIKMESGGQEANSVNPLFGPQLVGSIPNYSRRDLSIDVDDLPIGYDLGTGVASIRAPYNAGYKIIVGSADNLTVIGRALNDENAPITFIAGMAIRRSDKKKVELFTNGKGVFSATGMGPGEWEIVFNTLPSKTKIQFKLGENGGALRKLGDIKGVTE